MGCMDAALWLLVLGANIKLSDQVCWIYQYISCERKAITYFRYFRSLFAQNGDNGLMLLSWHPCNNEFVSALLDKGIDLNVRNKVSFQQYARLRFPLIMEMIEWHHRTAYCVQSRRHRPSIFAAALRRKHGNQR
jgi:hypothetical protein